MNVVLGPLFAFTHIELGGLSWGPPRIALFVSWAGIFQAFWLLVLMPSIEERLGSLRLTRWCFHFWPLWFTLPIFASLLAHNGKSGWAYALMIFS